MLNFDYQNPTRIVFGQGSTAKLARMVPQRARVLVLYGGGSVRSNGTLADVLDALKQNGQRYVAEFAGIEPIPTFETLMKAGPWGEAHARRIYARTRSGYHAVTRGTVDKLVMAKK